MFVKLLLLIFSNIIVMQDLRTKRKKVTRYSQILEIFKFPELRHKMTRQIRVAKIPIQVITKCKIWVSNHQNAYERVPNITKERKVITQATREHMSLSVSFCIMYRLMKDLA